MKKRLKLALLNALIAGGLVFLGSFTSGYISWQGVIASLSASLIVLLTKMREYLNLQKSKKAMKGGWFEFL